MEEICDELSVSNIVSEMASGATTLVPLTAEKVQEIVGDDDDPQFATFIIDGGWSKSRRYWGPVILDKIAEQVNSSSDVVGYQGHISPDRDAYDFPDIQMRWARAKIQTGGDTVKLLVKAYLLPGSKARDYVKRGLKFPVSIRGDAEYRPTKGGVEVKDFDLESIDMARPRKAGMGGRLAMVTSEMEGGKEVDGKEIAALSLDDLKAHNPLLVEKIENDACKPLNTKVSEMETENEAAQENVALMAKLREALGLDADADILEVIKKNLTALKESTKDAREAILDGVLKQRFKNDKDRALVRRVLASEMKNAELPDDPEEKKVKVTEMVNNFIDNDDDLKEIASEMESGGGTDLPNGDRSNDRSNGGKRELKPGYENDRIKVRKAR
jgi:hypothetical protein